MSDDGPAYLPNERLCNKPKIPLRLFDVFYKVYEKQGPLNNNDSTTHTFQRLCAKEQGANRYYHYRNFSNIRDELQAYKTLGLAERTEDGWQPTPEGERFYSLPKTKRRDWIFYKFYNIELSEDNQPVTKTAMGVAALQLKHGTNPELNDKELAVSVLSHPDNPHEAYQALINYRSSETGFEEWVKERGKRVGRMRKSGERLYRILKEHPFFQEHSGEYTIGVPECFFHDLVEYGRKAKQKQGRFLSDVDNPSAEELKKIVSPKRQWIVKRLISALSIDEVEARRFAKEHASSIFKNDDDIDKMNREERRQYRRRIMTFFERPDANLYSQLINCHPKQVKQNQKELAYFMTHYLREREAAHGDTYRDFKEEFNRLGASLSKEAQSEIQSEDRNNGGLFEEYIWKLMSSLDGEATIRPNARVDKDGRFEQHAPGGQGDIEGMSGEDALLLEPTLINTRDQYDKEATQIESHGDDLSDRTDLPADNAMRIQGQNESIGLYISPRDQSKKAMGEYFFKGHEKRILREIHEMTKSDKGGKKNAFIPVNLKDFYNMVKQARRQGKTREDIIGDLKDLATKAGQLTAEEWVRSIEEYCNNLEITDESKDMKQLMKRFQSSLKKEGVIFYGINPWTPFKEQNPVGFIVDLPDNHHLRVHIEKNGEGFAWEGDIQNGNHQQIEQFDEQRVGTISEVSQAIRRKLNKQSAKKVVEEE